MAKPRQGKAKVKITSSGNPKAAKNPDSPLRLSRKRWKCAGTKSKK